MKITAVDTEVVRLPLEVPFRDPRGELTFVDNILVRARTDEGPVGIGWAFSLNGRNTTSLKGAIDELKVGLVGRNPLRLGEVQDALRHIAFNVGPGGLITMATAALDVAVWDLRGKLLNLPIADLLGRRRDRVATYASQGLWRNYGPAELAAQAAEYVALGFRAVKLRVGGEADPEKEVERVRVIREAVGWGVDIMADVNQGWTPWRAIALGRRFQEYGLYWLEDPVPMLDLTGSAEVARALDLPVCAGEYHYDVAGLKRLLDERAVDILMIDLLRVGGITEWLKAAALAEAYQVPVVSHLVPEVHVHIFAAIPNGLTVEYMPWSFGLFKNPPRLVDGELEVPSGPGLGLELDEDRIARHRV